MDCGGAARRNVPHSFQGLRTCCLLEPNGETVRFPLTNGFRHGFSVFQSGFLLSSSPVLLRIAKGKKKKKKHTAAWLIQTALTLNNSVSTLWSHPPPSQTICVLPGVLIGPLRVIKLMSCANKQKRAPCLSLTSDCRSALLLLSAEWGHLSQSLVADPQQVFGCPASCQLWTVHCGNTPQTELQEPKENLQVFSRVHTHTRTHTNSGTLTPVTMWLGLCWEICFVKRLLFLLLENQCIRKYRRQRGETVLTAAD